MIQLPPGCTVGHSITIDIDNLSMDVIDWYRTVGGVVTEDKFYDRKGREQAMPYVQYGKGKKCHYHHNGVNNAVRLHFLGEDASVASMFLLKFMEHIVDHNLKEVLNRIEYNKY
jgi:hypothetical protein